MDGKTKNPLFLAELIIIGILFIFATPAMGYDDLVIHPRLTNLAVRNSYIDNYFIQQLAFEKGTQTRLPSNSANIITDYFRKGSTEEDNPPCRASNHFHNPLKPWDQAYMADDTTFLGGLIRQHCNSDGWPYSDRKSNLTWGTGYASSNGSPISRPRQEMGWDHARQYYYSALMSLSKGDRETYFVKTFQALGQVLHLLQDMSVPAHVRNDFTAHLIFQGFEGINPINWFSNPYEYYVKNHAALVNTSQPIYPGFTNPRVTDFWDTDLYTGSTQLGDLPVGLAEFTNAGYFSDSTIPNNAPDLAHSFLYPAVDSLNAQICEDYSEDLSEVKKYVSRRNRGVCPPLSEARAVDHFAVIGILEDPVITEANISSLKVLLDENVHDTYAKELIPLAIGYSAKLLDYFFRGQIQVTAVPIFYRGSLHLMRLKIKNMTDETMSNGDFGLTYRYTPPGGNADGSNDIFMPAWTVGGAALVPCIELRGQQEMVVDFRIDPPLSRNDYEALKFTLAYKGNLGNEAGAVIGKTFNPGRVIFEEEWDRPLPGSYVWAHTGFNLDSFNPGNGLSANIIGADILNKENIRSASSQLGRVNESFLGHGAFPGPFPLPITPNTYLMYKIDEMSMGPLNSADAVIGHQFLMLSFTNLLTLMISQEGQMESWNGTTAYYTFTPGQIVVDNIYESFQRAGIPIPATFTINFLSLAQRWYEIGGTASADHFQNMKVDFIQIVEGNVE